MRPRTPEMIPDAASKIAAQEFFNHSESLGVVECRSAVSRAMNDLKLDRGIHLFIGGKKFMRLVDGHLRVLISVQQEQGRIEWIHIQAQFSEPRILNIPDDLPLIRLNSPAGNRKQQHSNER